MLVAAVAAVLCAAACEPAWRSLPPAGPGSSVACSQRDPIPPGLAAQVASEYPGRRFTIAVDDQSGCLFTMNPGYRITTASVVKLEIMAGVLLRAQQQGRDLTGWERQQLWPMITESDDNSASALWTDLGGVPGMQAVDGAFGLQDTAPAGPIWGLTSTSAVDQVHLMAQVAGQEPGPLDEVHRAIARDYLTSVDPSQRWGATAGVPPGWTVGNKNGFAGSGCCGWRLNTVAWVQRSDGSAWTIAVLSDGWPDEGSGIAGVQDVAGRVQVDLSDPPAAGAGAVFSGADREDVFVRASSGALWQRVIAGGARTDWIDVGGLALSDPEAASSGAGDLPTIFVVGLDSALWQATWDGTQWRWSSLGGLCASAPAAVFSGADRLDVACVGADGAVWTRNRTSSTWGAWRSLGGRAVGRLDLAAAAVDGGDPTVYVTGTDAQSWTRSSAGSAPWSALGGSCTSGPSAVRTASDRVDLFCRGTDGALWTRSSLDDVWGGWTSAGGIAVSAPAAAAVGDGTPPEVFARGTDGAVWRWTSIPGGWNTDSWSAPRP